MIHGHRLEAVWHGPGPAHAPTLIFLHEGLGCVSMWRNFPEVLARATGCGALVYSRLGYGKSDPWALPRPIQFMHHEAFKVLPEIIGLLGIEKYILIGHSDGGSIALIFAGGVKPLSLKGLITEAAHVFCEKISVESIREAKQAFMHGELRKKLEKHHGKNTECAFWGWNDVWLHPDFRDWNIEEYLPGIDVPILAIQGEDDQYGTMEQVIAISKSVTGPSRVLKLQDCRHHPHMEQRETTLDAMIQFIQEIKEN